MASQYGCDPIVNLLIAKSTLDARVFQLEQNQGHFNSFLDQLHVNQYYQTEQQNDQARQIVALEKRCEQIEEECFYHRQMQLLMRREQRSIAGDIDQTVDRMFERLQGRIERELRRVDEQLCQLSIAHEKS